MAVTYQVDGPLIHVIAKGCVALVDFHDHLLERIRDPRIHENMCELLDATGLERIELSRSDIAALVQCQRDHATLFLPIPLAIVTREPVLFYARTFQSLAGSADRMIRIFPTRRQAEGWLRALQAVAGRCVGNLEHIRQLRR
jgi:hypothetical protein